MRKEKTIELNDRGNKLVFKIREMSATKTEYWIMRAIKLLGGAGVPIPNGADMTAAGRYLLAHIPEVLKQLDTAGAYELLNELLLCCSRVIGKVSEPCSIDTVDDYIEDARTLFALRMEALKVCFDFFGGEKPSESRPGPTIQLHGAQG